VLDLALVGFFGLSGGSRDGARRHRLEAAGEPLQLRALRTIAKAN
jgi:hypothetical protein